MSRALTLCLAIVVLAGTLLGVAVASAAPAPRPASTLPPSAFEVQGTNGYEVFVSSFRDPDTGRGWVGVIARRGDESASYTVPARVTEDSVRADLGDLGRIDMTLRLTGGKKSFDLGCVPRSEAYETGVYEGVFEFDGEGGYTRARTTEAAALPGIAVSAKEFCRDGSSGESRGPNLPGARLGGVSYADGRILKFQFNKNGPGARTVFGASLGERRDRVRIFREVNGVDPAGALRYPPDIRAAALAPPVPFSGKASLRRHPDSVSPSIGGSLKLSFPGRTIRLTGPSVHVTLVHARLEKGGLGSITVGI